MYGYSAQSLQYIKGELVSVGFDSGFNHYLYYQCCINSGENVFREKMGEILRIAFSIAGYQMIISVC